MIEKNLGNAERLIRLAFGLMLGLWMLTRQDINGTEIFVAVVSVFLILNGVFSRCYLWYVLDIDTTTAQGASPECKSV